MKQTSSQGASGIPWDFSAEIVAPVWKCLLHLTKHKQNGHHSIVYF